MARHSMLVLSAVVMASAALTACGLSSATHLPLSEPARHPSVAQVDRRSSASEDSVVGVFEGRTPCGLIATEFTGFPSQNCEKIKWRLTFYRDPSTGNPTIYVFDGTRTTRQGRWRIATGSGAAQGRVHYQLTYGESGRVLSLLNVDDNVLLLLDEDLRVVVGDASWSYVLNRVAPRGGRVLVPRSADPLASGAMELAMLGR